MTTVFSYKAKTSGGAFASGKIEADSASEARSSLVESGLFPLSLKSAGKRGVSRKRVPAVALTLFTKQLRTLLASGVTVVQALTDMADQESGRLSSVAREIASSVTAGSTLSEAFRKRDDVFGPLYCNLIKAGEESGSLPEVMDELVNVLEHGHRTKRDIRKAMTYPVIVLTSLVAAFFVMVMFVIPNFAKMFLKAGIDMPWPTRFCMGLYAVIRDWWPALIALAACAAFTLFLYARTREGRVGIARATLKIPVVGGVLLKGALARFSSVFGILQKNGILVADSIDLIAGTIGNPAVEREFIKAGIRLHDGRGIADSLSESPYFQGVLLSMVNTGERSGRLDEMLAQAAAHYDDEVRHEIGRLSDVVGPVMVAGLAVIVGFFALAIYMPLAEIWQGAMSGGF